MDWNKTFAARTGTMNRSPVREILKLTEQPDFISFAGGLPASEYFPVDHIREVTDTVIAEQGGRVLQYSTTEGMPELRQWIAETVFENDIEIDPKNVLIVSGSQQALDLLGRIMLDERDKVVVENPTYLAMLTAWNPYYTEYLAVPTDDDGLIVDKLEPALQQNPKMVYIVPNFQNPQGTTVSYERRVALVKLLAQYGVPLIEDNPYGELRYDGEPIPSLLEIDAQVNGLTSLDDGHVIYTGTFSKTLTPGLRIGYVVAPFTIIDKLVEVKQSADLHTSTLNQHIVYGAVSDGFLGEHLPHLCRVYRERRDIMLAAMERHFPPEVTWTKPSGGLFTLVRAPENINATALLERAVEYKVAFVPGEDFHIGGVGKNTFRLNFSNAKPDLIEVGIERIGGLLKEAMVAVQG